jgi:hypothetical protein
MLMIFNAMAGKFNAVQLSNRIGGNAMSYDALTIAAIVIVVVLIVVIILIGRSNANTEHKMRLLARHLMMLEGNEEARKLCRDIHKDYPDLCVGLDYTLRENGDSVEIDEWNADKPRPSS